ncbi:E3 ubiquitin-protein ligase XB3 [Hordeum vulgare]|nr:E3 ubiquitin-protein ligase XB3 [Hordeum vulgare]
MGAPGHASHVGLPRAGLTPHIFVPIHSSDQTLVTSLHPLPLPYVTQPHLRRSLAFYSMEDNKSDFDQSGSINWGVIPCGLEEAMSVRIALHHSPEDIARPMAGYARRDSISPAQRALGSIGAGSSRPRLPENLSFPITGPDCVSHEKRPACVGRRG